MLIQKEMSGIQGLDFGRITVLGVQTFSISSIALSEADVVEMVFQFPAFDARGVVWRAQVLSACQPLGQ